MSQSKKEVPEQDSGAGFPIVQGVGMAMAIIAISSRPGGLADFVGIAVALAAGLSLYSWAEYGGNFKQTLVGSLSLFVPVAIVGWVLSLF
jgi:hypothetical protein